MTARIVASPIKATHFVELIYTRDLSSYGKPEIETDYCFVYYDEEPADWQITELLPNGWTEIERRIEALNKEDLEEDPEVVFTSESDNWEDEDWYPETDDDFDEEEYDYA